MNVNEIIYVDVEVEGFPEKLWHPVEAKHQHGSCYLIIDSNDDPEHECWQFESGDIVHCETNEFYENETGLIAVSKCQCESKGTVSKLPFLKRNSVTKSQNNEKIEEILSKGIPLHPFHIHNWGLTKQQALIAINELKKCSIAILGGDVLKQEDERWVHTYDNWYCNPLPEESHEQYVIRSSKASADYIEKYKAKNEIENLFVIVAE